MLLGNTPDDKLYRVASKHYPGTVCEVIQQGPVHKSGHPVKHRCQFSFWCDGKPETVQDYNAWSKVTDYQRRTSPEENNPLLNELKAIVNSGYTFVDKSLEEEVHKLLAITKEKDQQTRDTTQCMWLVVVEEAPTGVRFSVAYTEEVNRWRSEWQEKGVFVEETLQANHPDIVGKLAMLQMCEIGQWVDGIGYKAAPTVYYVVR